MKQKRMLRGAVGFLVLGALFSYASAQKFEINPYAGFFFPDNVNFGSGSQELREEGIYGVRGGFFLTQNFEIEGNFGYINHFEFEGTGTESRGILWEASGVYHLPFLYKRLQPFVTAGVGGITAAGVDEDQARLAASFRRPVFEDGDTFFTFSYGGGVKAPRLWGPLGLRADVRGRTIPNLQGEASSWLELTGGVIFTWGTRE